MKKFKIVFLFICASALSNITYSQTKKIEQLKENVSEAPNDALKIKALLELCDQGNSLHPDSLLLYAGMAKYLADQVNDAEKKYEAIYYQSLALTNKGKIDSSLSLAKYLLSLFPNKLNNPVLKANLLNQKGRCFMRMNKYKDAIQMGLEVIDIAETCGDTLLQIKGKTLIGWAYLEMGQNKESLKWHLRALRTTGNKILLDKYGILFANIALNYNTSGQFDSAFYYIDRAINASRPHENLFALSNSLAIKAQLLVATGQGKKAEGPLRELVNIRRQIGDPFYITSDMAQLAFYYANNGQTKKGIELSLEGIEIAEKFKIDTKLFFLYKALAENYRKAGNMKRYANVLEKIIQLKDSVYQKNSAEALVEMQAKYNLQKKENQIIRQQTDITRQNYFFWGLLILLILFVGFAILLFNTYKKKQKLKMEIIRAEEHRMTSEAILKAEENERKRIAADLHDNMGAYASAILAGVDDLTLSRNNDIKPLLQNMKSNASGIMMDLRDTIWVLKKDAISITDISDRFKDYVQKISPSYPDIEIAINEKIINNKLLSPQIAFNMLRIMQEAFHNAIKHSHCTNLNISISYDGGPEIKITDNGIGFNNEDQLQPGNGLQNMQKRAKANGWIVYINRLTPSGTVVELTS
jgi:two-component system, NarL family, sensor kinase